MSELRDLYQEVILDHHKNPRNFGALPQADRSAQGYNPLCGDKVTVALKMTGDKIGEIRFEGSGCAISKASSSIMTTVVKGKGAGEIEKLMGEFQQMVTSPTTSPAPDLGKLSVLAGVREFPARVKCATLAWHTLKAALHDENKTVSTEEENG